MRHATLAGIAVLCCTGLAARIALQHLAPAAAPWAAVVSTGSIGGVDGSLTGSVIQDAGPGTDRVETAGSGVEGVVAAAWRAEDANAHHIYAANFSNASAPERQCLARAVYFEARGEPTAGQIAIAQVILNRVASKRWASTICGVVYQGSERGAKCQFSFACTDQRKDLTGEAWDQAVWIADEAVSGGAWLGELLHADHFHRTGLRPVWRLGLQYIRAIGNHVFYAPLGAVVDRTWVGVEDRSAASGAKADTGANLVTGSVAKQDRIGSQVGPQVTRSSRPTAAVVEKAPHTVGLSSGDGASVPAVPTPSTMPSPANRAPLPPPSRSHPSVAEKMRAAAPSTGWVTDAFRN